MAPVASTLWRPVVGLAIVGLLLVALGLPIEAPILQAGGGGANNVYRYPVGPGDTLGSPRSISTNVSVGRFLTGDVNGDGVTDLVGISNDASNRLIYWQGGTNLVNPFPSRTDFPLPSPPVDLAVGDVDNDGDDDMVVALQNGAIQTRFGAFGTTNLTRTFNLTPPLVDLALGRLEVNDVFLDYLIANGTDATMVTRRFSQGQLGTITTPGTCVAPFVPQRVEFSPVSKLGAPGLELLLSAPGRLGKLDTDGTGTCPAGATLVNLINDGSGHVYSPMGFFDVNRDGLLDVWALNRTTGALETFHQGPAGAYGPRVTVPLDGSPAAGPQSVASGVTHVHPYVHANSSTGQSETRYAVTRAMGSSSALLIADSSGATRAMAPLICGANVGVDTGGLSVNSVVLGGVTNLVVAGCAFPAPPTPTPGICPALIPGEGSDQDPAALGTTPGCPTGSPTRTRTATPTATRATCPPGGAGRLGARGPGEECPTTSPTPVIVPLTPTPSATRTALATASPSPTPTMTATAPILATGYNNVQVWHGDPQAPGTYRHRQTVNLPSGPPLFVLKGRFINPNRLDVFVATPAENYIYQVSPDGELQPNPLVIPKDLLPSAVAAGGPDNPAGLARLLKVQLGGLIFLSSLLPLNEIRIPCPGCGKGRGALVGHMNGDRIEDFIVLWEDGIRIYLSEPGGGHTVIAVPLSNVTALVRLAFGQEEAGRAGVGSSTPALAVTRSFGTTLPGTVQLVIGDGAGGLTPGESMPAGVDPRAMTASDINGDGQLDLLIVNRGSNTLSVYLGNPLGSGFLPKVDVATGPRPFAIEPTVVDGEITGFAVANGDGTVSIFTNLTARGSTVPLFLRRDAPCGAGGLYDIGDGDMNGDGIGDLVLGGCHGRPGDPPPGNPGGGVPPPGGGGDPPPPPPAPPTPPPPIPTQLPLFSVAPNGPSGCDPADILTLAGFATTSCAATGSPGVVIACRQLTFPESCSAPGAAGPPQNDDVAALAFANEPPGDSRVFFSVDNTSAGCQNTAVSIQAGLGHPEGDEFTSVPGPNAPACNSGNSLYYTAPTLGLIESSFPEPPNNDDELDALAFPALTPPFFTLAPGSPTLARIGATPGDILTTPKLDGGPVIALPHTALGLRPTDAIDALCLFGPPSTSTVVFSLARGSPSLAGPDGQPGTADDFSPADLLFAGPALFRSAASIGLLATDNLDAVKCHEPSAPPIPTPGPSRTPTHTPTPSAVGGRSFTLQAGLGATTGPQPQGAPPRVLSWIPGTQTTSLLLRWSPEHGFAFLPPQGPGVSTYTDSESLTDPTYCYVLLAMFGDPAALDLRGISDLLCITLGSGTGAHPPTQFRVRLNESPIAELGWTAPASAGLGVRGAELTGYELHATRFDGSPPRTIPVGPGQTSFREATGGQTTCYRLVARAGAAELGGTTILCAAPGIGNFTSGGTTARAALERLVRQLAPASP